MGAKKKPARKTINLQPQKTVDWTEIELLYVTSPKPVSLRDLAKRLNLSASTVMAQALRGKWNAKRAGAKGKLSIAPSMHGKLAEKGGQENGESGDSSDIPDECPSKSTSTEEKPRAGFLAVHERTQSLTQVRATRAETYDKAMAALAERLPAAMVQMTDKELLAHSGDIAKLDGINRKALGIDGAESTRAPLVQINLLSTGKPSKLPTVIDVNPTTAPA
jgi:hypothetical protein